MLYIYKTFLDNISTEEQVEEVHPPLTARTHATHARNTRPTHGRNNAHHHHDDDYTVSGQSAVVAGRPLPRGRVAVPPVQGRARRHRRTFQALRDHTGTLHSSFCVLRSLHDSSTYARVVLATQLGSGFLKNLNFFIYLAFNRQLEQSA